MSEKIVDIVAWTLEMLQHNHNLNDTVVVKQLLQHGFAVKDISVAFSWILEQLQNDRITNLKVSMASQNGSFRIFSREEEKAFTKDAFSTITKLLSAGVILAPHVEIIFEHLQNTNITKIDNKMVQDIVIQLMFDIPMIEDNNVRYSLYGNESIN